ncbi:MAG: ABC transporter permease [Firmicutes bacterium]|jgi:putative ABC transport system permease protein|nr:ABC transporter permease [Bacillota bacterium]MDH7495911.1 ABC transporter permease [Bacillota bacterium]
MLSIALTSAYHNVRRRPLRAVLTILQIGVGIACVVSVLSYRMNVSAWIGRMMREGEDMVVATGGREGRNEYGGWTREIYALFSNEDVSEIASLPDVEGVSPFTPRPLLTVDAANTRYLVNGGASVGPDYARVCGLETVEGAFITQSDVESGSSVVVISENLAKILFGTAPYVGRTIEVVSAQRGASPKAGGGRSAAMPTYRVIGVFRENRIHAGTPFLVSYWEAPQILWPATVDPLSPMGISFRSAVSSPGNAYPYTTLVIRAKAGRGAAVREHVRAMVSGRGGPRDPWAGSATLDNGNGDDDASEASVMFESSAETARMLTRSMSDLTLLLGGAVFIALVVSAIGILSIMMVGVVERSREVGLRRAFGASRGSIVLQFTFDSVAMSLAGGVLGVLASLWLYPFLDTTVFTRMSIFSDARVGGGLSPVAVLAGLGLAIVFGAVFGFVPALQAARVEPAEILREL